MPMNLPIRRHDAHPAPDVDRDATRARVLEDVDWWLASLADQLDKHVARLAEVEEAFPVARRLAHEGGEDELSVRRGERAYLEGVEQLAVLGSALRRGTAVGLGPRHHRAPEQS